MPWMAALGAAGAAGAGGAALGAGGATALGAGLGAAGLGSALQGGMGASGAGGMGNALGNLLGNQGLNSLLSMGSKGPGKIKYKPVYGSPYSYDPYAWAPGEEGLYTQLMDEILNRSRLQERMGTQDMSEALNQRGLGSSSVYQFGRSNIANQAQAMRAREMGEAERHKFGLHESRAEQQRQRQHEWNVGPGVQQKRDTIAAQQGFQADRNAMNVQAQQPYYGGGNQGGFMGAMTSLLGR